MDDAQTTLTDLKKSVDEMIAEREWNGFHTLKNLAMNISVEAAELMEHFLWCSSDQSTVVLADKRKEVEDELADVLIALVAFANAAEINISHAFKQKLEEIKNKYPVALSRGKADKYTHYQEIKDKAKK